MHGMNIYLKNIPPIELGKLAIREEDPQPFHWFQKTTCVFVIEDLHGLCLSHVFIRQHESFAGSPVPFKKYGTRFVKEIALY